MTDWQRILESRRIIAILQFIWSYHGILRGKMLPHPRQAEPVICAQEGGGLYNRKPSVLFQRLSSPALPSILPLVMNHPLFSAPENSLFTFFIWLTAFRTRQARAKALGGRQQRVGEVQYIDTPANPSAETAGLFDDHYPSALINGIRKARFGSRLIRDRGHHQMMISALAPGPRCIFSRVHPCNRSGVFAGLWGIEGHVGQPLLQRPDRNTSRSKASMQVNTVVVWALWFD
ncbi:hypothetical protein VTK56DRAFT_5257 [Thermocarpiscus australiensis]